MASEVKFSVVRRMLEEKGYSLSRIRSSHHVFVKPGCRAFPVPVHSGKVKPCYVRLIERLE